MSLTITPGSSNLTTSVTASKNLLTWIRGSYSHFRENSKVNQRTYLILVVQSHRLCTEKADDDHHL